MPINSIQDIPGQSGAGMVDMFSSKPAQHTYRAEWPSSKVNKPLKFVCPKVFDAYIAQLRSSGAVVTFKSPFLALVEVAH